MSDNEQAQPAASTAGTGWGCLGLIAIVLAIQLWNAIFGGYSPGTKYVIAFDSNGFSNAEARESYIESSKLGDQFGVDQLFASGQLASLVAGSDTLVLDRKFRPLMLLDPTKEPRAKRSAWLVQVRILSGLHLGKKFWVESAVLANRPPRAKQRFADPERGERSVSDGRTNSSVTPPYPDHSTRQKELLKSILEADPSPNEVKARAWDAFMSTSDTASFRSGFDALPLDHLTKRQIYFLKFPQSYKVSPPDKRDVGGNKQLLEYLGVAADSLP
jgi:hypothetical protein